MPTARTADLDTSHEAARSVKNLSETKEAILRILRTKQLTDDQIYQIFFQGAEQGYWSHASMSGVRSRRAELVRDGLVKQVAKSETRFGRKCYVWGLA